MLDGTGVVFLKTDAGESEKVIIKKESEVAWRFDYYDHEYDYYLP